MHIVLVIASRTVGVKLSDEAVDAVRALAKAVDLPLLVLATSHYVDDLQQRFDDPEFEAEVVQIGGEIVEEILEQTNERDQVIVTAMGSRDRLVADE